MRHVLICAVCIATAWAARPPRPAALTIVLEFQGAHSDRSIDAMKRELEALMTGAPIALSWRSPAEVMRAPVDNLVLFRFKGKCILEPVGYLLDERCPLAFTYLT